MTYRPLRRLLALLPVTLAAACMLSPFDGQVVESRDELIDFEGFYSAPGEPVSIRAWNHARARWDAIGTTRSDGRRGLSVEMFGSRWFFWRTKLRLEDTYWQPAAKGARARVKAVGEAGTHMTVRQDGQKCMMDADKRGDSVIDARRACAAEHSPEAWLYTADYCAETVQTGPAYRVRMNPSREDGYYAVHVVLFGDAPARGLGPGARATLRFYDGDRLLGSREHAIGAERGASDCYVDDAIEGFDAYSRNVEGWKVIRCRVPLAVFGTDEPCRYHEFTNKLEDDRVTRPLYNDTTRFEVEVTAAGRCGGTRVYDRVFADNDPGNFPCSCRDELYGREIGICQRR